MSEPPSIAGRIVIVGAGPAGRAAAALLPMARLVAPPERAWHAEPGRVWILREGAIAAIPFDTLVLAAPVLHLLLALGCRMRGLRPEIDAAGRTSVAGVFAAGAVLGAAGPTEAARQGRIVAQAILGLPAEGAIAPGPPPARLAADEALAAALGVVRVTFAGAGAVGLPVAAPPGAAPLPFAPAVPVPFAALAARAGEPPPPRPPQRDPVVA